MVVVFLVVAAAVAAGAAGRVWWRQRLRAGTGAAIGLESEKLEKHEY